MNSRNKIKEMLDVYLGKKKIRHPLEMPMPRRKIPKCQCPTIVLEEDYKVWADRLSGTEIAKRVRECPL